MKMKYRKLRLELKMTRETIVCILQKQINGMTTWTRSRRGKLDRETELLFIAAQNNYVRTNYIKTKIYKYKTQKNNQCWWSGNNNMVKHIIRECSKLAQKEYRNRRDWVKKLIHRELCEQPHFDHKNQWWTHRSKSALKKMKHKLCGFEIQTNYHGRRDLVLVKRRRKNMRNSGFLSSRMLLKIYFKKVKR